MIHAFDWAAFWSTKTAVKAQIGSGGFTYVLIAIAKKALHLNASLYTLLQILSVSIFEKPLFHGPYNPIPTKALHRTPATN